MHMRKILSAFLVMAWLVALGWSAPGGASASDIISGALTADNAFILYYGAANGGNLTPITSGNNWTVAYPFSVSVPAGSYLYVLAWNHLPNTPAWSNPQAWLGQFNLPGGTTLYSDLTQWQYTYTTSGNPSLGSPVPDLGIVAGLIANAQWLTATPNYGPSFSRNTDANGDPNSFWGYLSQNYGVPLPDINANWIWFDRFDISSASEYGYAIFRTNDPVAPVPPTLLLLGSGLLGLAGLGWRRKVISERYDQRPPPNLGGGLQEV